MPRAGKPTARAAALPWPALLAAFEKVRRSLVAKLRPS